VTPRKAVEPLVNRVKALGAILGGARDWDVFVTETLPSITKAFPDHPGFEAIATSAEHERAAARDRVRAAVAAPTHTGLLLELGSQLAAQPWRAALDVDALALEAMSIERFAAMLLDRQWKRVRRGGRNLRELEPAQLHELRIEVKKLRYAMEFFEALHARKAVRAFLDHAAELQEILGTLNDAAVTSQLLDTMATEVRPTAEAVGIVRGWVAASAQLGLAHLESAWKRFEDAESYW
jgi:triphosphatase